MTVNRAPRFCPIPGSQRGWRALAERVASRLNGHGDEKGEEDTDGAGVWSIVPLRGGRIEALF
jgi:hypothetical protein